MKPTNTQKIVVEADGELLIAIDGHFHGTPVQKRKIEDMIARGAQIRLHPRGDYIQPYLESPDPIVVTAALFSYKDGRSRLIEAPEAVYAFLEGQELRYPETLEEEDTNV